MIKINVTPDKDTATPLLTELQGAMQGDRRDFLGYVARSVAAKSQDYVRSIAPTRHATATGLGAKPTGHLMRAASSIEGQWDNTRAMLVFPRTTGLSRAFRDFNLVPVSEGIKWLTIPANARSYGRRAREFGDLEFRRVPGPLNAPPRAALVFPDGAVAYFLVKQAHIPQDRTLLPSDAEFAEAAEIGAFEYIRALTDA